MRKSKAVNENLTTQQECMEMLKQADWDFRSEWEQYAGEVQHQSGKLTDYLEGKIIRYVHRGKVSRGQVVQITDQFGRVVILTQCLRKDGSHGKSRELFINDILGFESEAA